MAKGGITKGNSHKEGGIPMEVKSTGQKVELEGGEGVINKRNMSDTKKHTFDGKELTKCEIASEINSDNNNGVKIECDDITGKEYKYKKGGGVDGERWIKTDGTESEGSFVDEADKRNMSVKSFMNKALDYPIRDDFDNNKAYQKYTSSKKGKKEMALRKKAQMVKNMGNYEKGGKTKQYYEISFTFEDEAEQSIGGYASNEQEAKELAKKWVKDRGYTNLMNVEAEVVEPPQDSRDGEDFLRQEWTNPYYEKGGNLEYTKDSLGIARKDMPQIRKDNYPEFFNELKGDDVFYYNMYINPNDYKASQSYIDLERIKEIEDSPAYKNNKPILVSKDYYVLDGHHRWYYKRKIKDVIPAIVIDLPIKELIERARNFSEAEFDTYKKGGQIDRSKYVSMFADTDGDGIPNVDDVSPFNKSKRGQIEEVSMSEEMGEIIDYRNKFEHIREKFVDKLSGLSGTCGTAKCGILSRTKTPYSIINKLRRRSLTGVKDLIKLEDKAKSKLNNNDLSGLDLYKGLTDVVGAMVIAPNIEILNKIKDKILKGEVGEVLEFEDFYAEPRAGYRAYHFIIGVKDKGMLYPIEVQLKTERGKKLSELSHTLYKRGKLDTGKYEEMFRVAEKADNGDKMSAMKIDTMLKNPAMMKEKIRLDDGANIKSLKEKFMEGGKITGTTIESLIPYYQLQALKEGEREILRGDREENLFLEDVEFGYKNIPKLGAQDGKGKNQVVYLHYFMGGSDFYITELDKESLMGFGYVIQNGDTQMSELGSIYIPELTDKTLGNALMNMNIDQNFSPKTLNQVFQSKYTELAEDDFEEYEDIKVVEELETSDYLNMDFKNPYERNLVIRELIEDKGDDTNNYTIDEKEFIRQYSGMGGLQKYGATGAGLLYEYYTPKEIVEKMWGLAYKHRGNIQIKDVLEPSCATGNFIGYAPLDVNITGYDIDKFSLSVCRVLYPEERFSFIKAPFESLFFKGNKSVGDKVEPYYDLVIGNPPYGKFSGKYAGMGEKQATEARDYIDYFITRGLDLLKPNGLLIFIIGKLTQLGGKPFVEQMKSPNKGQIRIQNKADLVDAYRLPIGMFETTDVESEIIVLRKK